MSITLTADQLDWYNRGIVLLMSVMRGRAYHGQAERAVYDDWRKDGELLEVQIMTTGVCTSEDCNGERHECWNCGGDGWEESEDWQDFGAETMCQTCKNVGSWPCPLVIQVPSNEVPG